MIRDVGTAFFGLLPSRPGFCFRLSAATTMISELRRARERVELEESRVFDFLHGLGAAVSEETIH